MVRSLHPGTSFWGNTQRSEPVSTRNIRLLTQSVMNRWPVGVEQKSSGMSGARLFRWHRN